MEYPLVVNEKILLLYRLLWKLYLKILAIIIITVSILIILFLTNRPFSFSDYNVIYAIFSSYYIILSLTIYRESRSIYGRSFIYSILSIGLTYSLLIIGLYYALEMVDLHRISGFILLISIFPLIGYLYLNTVRVKVSIEFKEIVLKPRHVYIHPIVLIIAILVAFISEIHGYHNLIIHLPLLIASALTIRLLEYRFSKVGPGLFKPSILGMFSHNIESSGGPLVLLVKPRFTMGKFDTSFIELLDKYASLSGKCLVEFLSSKDIKAAMAFKEDLGKLYSPVIVKLGDKYIYEDAVKRLENIINNIIRGKLCRDRGLVLILRTSILNELPSPYTFKYVWFRTLIDLLGDKDTLILVKDTPDKESLGPIEYFISFVIHTD